MSSKTPSQDLLVALADANVPKSVIARKLALAPSSVSDLYAGRRTLKHDEAVILLKLARQAAKDLVQDAPEEREIPIIGMAGAGNWVEAIERSDEFLKVPSQLDSAARFAVEVSGQSMNMLIPEGSFAMIDPGDRDLYVGKLYLLQNAEGETTIKRYRIDPARFEPVSTDPSFQPFPIHSLEFRVVGRVTGAMQRF